MSIANVPPRVLPLFLHEVVTTPHALRVENIEHLLANVDDVFMKAKVEDEDLMDMLVTLLSLCKKDATFFERPPVPQDDSGMPIIGIPRKESAAQLTIRLLTHISQPTWPQTAAMYRALGKIINRIRSHREDLVPEEILAADHTPAVNDTLDNLSPVKSDQTTNGDASIVATTAAFATISAATANPEEVAAALAMDGFLAHDDLRAATIDLWRVWDQAGIDVSYFCEASETLHVYLPHRLTSRLKVYRDFAFCTQRPKLTKQWGSTSIIHVKTNIKAQTDVMYRFLVEGYNYGVNAAVHSDVVGYTNRRWDDIGNMTKYGWPEGWDAEMTNDYAAGCTISQYYSSDRYLVLRCKAKSFFSVGFSVSAWLVFHGLGEGYPVAVTFHHQDDDL